MTPEQATRINDLRMKVLEAIQSGRDIKTVITKEELKEALDIVRAARRASSDSHASGRVSTKAKGKSAPVDMESLAAKLGL